MSGLDSSSDDARRANEERERQAYLASRDYARWKRLERMQDLRFVRSIEDHKPFFDLLRMVLTTALLVGLFTFVIKNGPADGEGNRAFPILAIPLVALAILAGMFTWHATVRYVALAATSIAISNRWPFKAKSGSASVSLYLALWMIQLFFFASMLALGWLVADQAATRGHPHEKPPITSAAK